jgi:hypothetical protein
MTIEDPRRRAFVDAAAHMWDEQMRRIGPDSGDTLDDIEALAEKQVKELARILLKARLRGEEQAQCEGLICPRCARPMRRPSKPASRALETTSGTVHYQRRHAICDHCGASFSPSGPAPQDPPARGIGPSATQNL